MKQYDLWWADLPEPAGRRPVLLLTRDGAYAYLYRVLAVEVSTTIHGIPQEVPLGPRDGLRGGSVANFDNIRRIRVSSLRERIAALSPGRIREVKRAMGHSLMWIELTKIS